MATDPSDEQLRHDVLDELGWDALVDAGQLDVDVTDGVVTLVGTVDSLARKLTAQEAAHAVDGVRDLVNAIDVRPPAEARPTDADLEDMARRVLTWDSLVPEQEIDVHVADGWVVLTGHVAVAAQRQEAERAVARLAGVRGVTAELTVQRPELRPDEVRDSIEVALRRRARHRAAQIAITVDDRDVTLEGRVQTAREKIAILGAVAHAPGIEAVHDELRIDPST